MDLIDKGAEADLYRHKGKLVKCRVRKKYRVKELDEKLRSRRTKRESRLLKKAKRVGVPVPSVYNVNVKDRSIEMEYIKGRSLKDFFDSCRREEIPKIAKEVGEIVARLHEHNIIHNDLTSSNMIFGEGGIYLIDFGLGVMSTRVEDKAMDLVVLKKSLNAAHTSMSEDIWKYIIEGYNPPERKKIIDRISTIEKRVRYS